MNGYSQSEIKKNFGSSKFNEEVLGKIKYISGSSFLDKLQLQKKSFDVQKNERGIVFKIMHGWWYKYAGIKLEDINYIAIEPQEQLFGKTQKSVIGRAIVGGLLLGPLGAVVGGMSGIGSSTNKLSSVPDNMLIVSYNEGDKEKFVFFEVQNKDYQKLDKFFQSYFSGKYKTWQELEKEKTNDNTITSLSIADEIKKLKELLDLGAITSEEFEQQKIKLLNK